MSLFHRLKALRPSGSGRVLGLWPRGCGGKSELEAGIAAWASASAPFPPDVAHRRLLDGTLLKGWPNGLGFGLPEGRLGAGSRLALFTFGSRSLVEVARVGPGPGLWLRFAGGALAGTCELVAAAEGSGSRLEFRLRAEPLSRWMRLVCLLTDPGAHLSRWASRGLAQACASDGASVLLRPQGPA